MTTGSDVGRIIASVKIENPQDPAKDLRCDALVDTDASHLILPAAWKDRMGRLDVVGKVQCETATQETVEGEVCGPVRIQLEGFRPIYSELIFIEMHPSDGTYEPLIGHLVLQQSQAAVDMVGHCLVHEKHVDLK